MIQLAILFGSFNLSVVGLLGLIISNLLKKTRPAGRRFYQGRSLGVGA